MPDLREESDIWVRLAGRLANIEANQAGLKEILTDFIQVQRHCNDSFERRHEDNEGRITKLETAVGAINTKLAIGTAIGLAALAGTIGILIDILTHGGKIFP